MLMMHRHDTSTATEPQAPPARRRVRWARWLAGGGVAALVVIGWSATASASAGADPTGGALTAVAGTRTGVEPLDGTLDQTAPPPPDAVDTTAPSPPLPTRPVAVEPTVESVVEAARHATAPATEPVERAVAPVAEPVERTVVTTAETVVEPVVHPTLDAVGPQGAAPLPAALLEPLTAVAPVDPPIVGLPEIDLAPIAGPLRDLARPGARPVPPADALRDGTEPDPSTSTAPAAALDLRQAVPGPAWGPSPTDGSGHPLPASNRSIVVAPPSDDTSDADGGPALRWPIGTPAPPSGLSPCSGGTGGASTSSIPHWMGRWHGGPGSGGERDAVAARLWDPPSDPASLPDVTPD